MLRRIIVLTILLCLSISSVSAQNECRFFTWAPYGQSLYADTHPDFCRLDISSVSMRGVYDYAKSGSARQCHTFGTFGFNLPLFLSELQGGRFGLNVTLPLSATLWMDLFEPATSAIVNTDYRIAAPALTFIHRLPSGYLHNYSISLAPFKHESTHVGDELVLQRVQDDYALRRVNVSYNYAELKFTLNEPEDRMKSAHTFKLSVMVPLPARSGLYFVEDRDGDIRYVKASSIYVNSEGNQVARGPVVRFPETYVQYQWQSPVFSKASLQGLVSAECRLRARYGYDLSLKETDTPAASDDAASLCVNTFIGIRCNQGREGYFCRSAIGFRAYYGTCPYGQFRYIPGFSQFGLCIIFE